MDNKKSHSKITDFETFWKIVVIVCMAIIAEGIIVWTATSDMAVDWTYNNVFVKKQTEQVALDDQQKEEDKNITDKTETETKEMEENAQ